MKKTALKFKTAFSDKKFSKSVLFGFILLILSFIVNFYAGMYATENASSSVKDIVLSNIPVFDVDLIFVYGPIILWAFVTCLMIYEPKRIPFVLKSVAIFIIIRAVFISLTHIGPFPDQIISRPDGWAGKFIFGGDLFFSAHTGLPFLMALVFWDNKLLRIIFTITAVFFGVIVLLGHLHYTIDVLSAFFITYTIFHIAQKIFPMDWKYFNSDTMLLKQ